MEEAQFMKAFVASTLFQTRDSGSIRAVWQGARDPIRRYKTNPQCFDAAERRSTNEIRPSPLTFHGQRSASSYAIKWVERYRMDLPA